MQTTDIDVLEGISNWINSDQDFWLCSIISTYGSSPRPIGSIFAWNGKHKLGSISGGCLEEAFIAKLNRLEFNRYPCQFTYGQDLVSQNETSELPCGGSIQLLIEHITPTADHKLHIQSWLALLTMRLPFYRTVSLVDGTLSLDESTNINSSTDVSITEHEIQFCYLQVWRLLILGISHVSECTARLAKMLGFSIQVCDMREELASSWHFDKSQGGVDITWQCPDVFVEQWVDKQTAIVALAHDPRIDDIGLMSALESNAFYIGAMGSVKTTQKRVERLQRVGEISVPSLQRLNAPIGVDIGSKTPMEIAVSILAEVVATKNNIKLTATDVANLPTLVDSNVVNKVIILAG
ncbi:hypothetical protein GCM10007916_29900 [Psychromonas marina]|uniref:XdhC family protein n=1 Tax=Psychromonas marina TaxID=88364 RepID=A0ABQ6E412_9GAMM|nr:XdhC/CoxI family protein [Psychromonas marina]GLS91920.1 hypothetical protein GCM10007916_29900 [Psychromonas marina]